MPTMLHDPEPRPDEPLTPDQVTLVKGTWRQLAPKLTAVAERFYARLFELDPGLQSLFSETDMEKQGGKFMDTITVLVKGLDHFGVLVPAIGELGRRHAGYGVREEHYELVGQALIGALESQLGDDFTDKACEAWTATYNAVAEIMKAGPTGEVETIPALRR